MSSEIAQKLNYFQPDSPDWSWSHGSCLPYSEKAIFDDAASVASVLSFEYRSDGQSLVKKQISLAGLSQEDRSKAMQEVECLRSLRHPNIIELSEAFTEVSAAPFVTDALSSHGTSRHRTTTFASSWSTRTGGTWPRCKLSTRPPIPPPAPAPPPCSRRRWQGSTKD